MKRYIMVLAALAVMSSLGWAEDGAALYKSKCAMCHGAAGEGKSGPSLQKTAMTQAQVDELLTKGAAGKKAPHAKAMASLSAEQATAVSTFVATLKK
jgi:mono/diheme cytochrome c family protein